MVINRVMKRLAREDLVTTIPRSKDKCYLYMPNPTLINPHSQTTQHFLGIADLYISLDQPEIYEVEPIVNDYYRPDAYTIVNNNPVVIEYQRSFISNNKMQQKVNHFVKAYKDHGSKTLWIVSDYRFKVKCPEGFHIIQKKVDQVI